MTVDESRRVMDVVTAHRGLMVRDAREVTQDFKGEVVAVSMHHALLRVSDRVVIRYEKTRLDREVNLGEKVVIQHGRDKCQVREQGKVPSREPSRDRGRELSR